MYSKLMQIFGSGKKVVKNYLAGSRGLSRLGGLAQNEVGSLSTLISGLFLIVFILSMGIIDISDSYLAKRELIQIGEDAILVAAHSLDKNRYYSNSSSPYWGTNARVPIDCSLAAIKFSAEISEKRLRQNSIAISSWECSDDQISATISSKIVAIINFPILSNISGGAISIGARVGATSAVGSS
jgi:hypothetical protein